MTALVADPVFMNHIAPLGHPEREARMQALLDWAAPLKNDPNVVWIHPRPATRDEIEAVHAPGHFDAMAETAGREVTLDPDTYTSPLSFETALLAAGSCIDLVDAVLDGRAVNGLALIRPPGHHAETNRAMGFCLFNNVAVAAAHAQRRGAERVFIVDWDVHHGNGTQEIFYEDPSVFFISLHQYPFYPGTGASSEKGLGAGKGFTLNIPLRAGCGDVDYLRHFREKIVPAGQKFAPDLVMISAGFDAHARDPLGGMRVTTPGFAQLAEELIGLARDACGGKIVAFLEGGYDLQALRNSVSVVASAMIQASAALKQKPA
jgi:acetoin utilization deacetylase AcuC-like enzyme